MRSLCHAVILLVGLALLAISASAGGQKPRADRPTYTLGEKWIRSDGVYDLIRIENGRYIFAASADRQVHLTQDLALAKVQRGGYIMEFEPPPRLTWPLEVGKWGRVPGTWRGPLHPGGLASSVTWSVQAYEPVHVVAGTFKAFRISLFIEGRGAGSGRPFPRELFLWYVPEVRQFVKAEGRELDLLAFQVVALDQPAPLPLRVALEAGPCTPGAGRCRSPPGGPAGVGI